MYMTKFRRTASTPYTLMTPATELAELERFLDDNLFALGKRLRATRLDQTSTEY
jgi:hypothetical protein